MVMVEMVPEVKLSVCMITYNHELFLAQAIESVLEQKTDFPIELIIGEDCSTDGTANIVRYYTEKHPEKIQALVRDKNIGPSRNLIDTFKHCNGKYVAVLEGDDYWTDPLKLQKQVGFMDANPGYSLCCHRYKVYDQENGIWGADYSAPFAESSEAIDINPEEFADFWFTKTLTVIFRRDMLDIAKVAQYSYFRDFHLIYHLLLKGKGRLLNFIGGGYRKHQGGIYSKKDALGKLILSNCIYREMYSINKTDIIKKIYFENYSRLLDAKIRIKKIPCFSYGIHVDNFRLLVTFSSPKQFILKTIKIFAYSLLPKTVKKINKIRDKRQLQ
jgi:glycosyltransferase involved in cell wall biosynthesis